MLIEKVFGIESNSQEVIKVSEKQEEMNKNKNINLKSNDSDKDNCLYGTGKKSIYDILEEEIMGLDISDAEKTIKLSKLLNIRGKKVNIMIAGATGSGKSSTINALFNMEVAKVGVGVDPETDSITEYQLENLTIWDTPGLGDGVKRDERIKRLIIKKLNEIDDECNPLIDMVIVIIDASSKDLGTSYDLINNVLIPCLGMNDANDRIILAINQSDMAMKGNHWDSEKNEPDDVLKAYLKKKAESIQSRIKDGTGINIKPICYCAGYKEEGGKQRKPYNLNKLLYYIIKAIPKEKRMAIADNLNHDKNNWIYDDHEDDYKSRTKSGFFDTIWDCVSDGSSSGYQIGGEILGIPGKIVGGIVGGTFGAVMGVLTAIFG